MLICQSPISSPTVSPAGVDTLDVCGLEPPEPMARILDALERLCADERLHVVIDRTPLPLFGILADNGFSYRFTPRNDNRFNLTIWATSPHETRG